MKTHCCFCGQQCGIQLKVRDNQVVGFEPWEEFPFNQGMLCPKGVKRYLQSEPPRPAARPAAARTGRRASARPPGTRRSTSRRAALRRDPGAATARTPSPSTAAPRSPTRSPTCGQVRPRRPRHRHIDYNGRLCMVSAGTAYKLAFGVDRSPNPWSDIPQAEVVFVAGANVAECAPITTQLHLALPRPRRQAHRRRPADDARSPAPPTSTCRSAPAPTRRF